MVARVRVKHEETTGDEQRQNFKAVLKETDDELMRRCSTWH